MNKTLKIALIAIGTLSLFACDGGTTSKSNNSTGIVTDPNQNPGGSGQGPVDTVKTYKITVDATGIKSAGNTDQLVVDYNGEALNFTTAGQKTFTATVEKDKGYTVTVTSSPALQTCLITNNGTVQTVTADTIVSVACTDKPVIVIGNAITGESYYMSECAVCHRSGIDDKSVAYGSSDLAENYQLARDSTPSTTNIKIDMHSIGPVLNLMGRFTAIPTDRVADLEAYLGGVTLVVK